MFSRCTLLVMVLHLVPNGQLWEMRKFSMSFCSNRCSVAKEGAIRAIEIGTGTLRLFILWCGCRLCCDYYYFISHKFRNDVSYGSWLWVNEPGV